MHTLIQIGFILITVVYFGLLIVELKRGINRTSWSENQKHKLIRGIVIFLLLWVALVSAWSLSGVMSDFSKFPFNLLPVVAIPLVTAIVLMFSKTLGEILQLIPAQNLIRLQSFRVFVEILLWALFVQNTIPVQMTFEGMNFDILAGLTAPVIAWLISRNKISKTVVAIWNIACLGLLINIVSIAILSTPSPIRLFMNEPSNTVVAHFPVSWLPGLLVPLAYTLHFFSLKQMFSKSVKTSAAY